MAKGETWNLVEHSYFNDVCILLMQTGNLLGWKGLVCLKNGSTDPTKIVGKKEEALSLAQEMIKQGSTKKEGGSPGDGDTC